MNDVDSYVLGQCKDDINYVNTMAYDNDLSGMQTLYNWYGNALGDKSRVFIGVKAGFDQNTQLSVVKQVAAWLKSINTPHMMLWNLTSDIQGITGEPDGTFFNTIVTDLSSSAAVAASSPSGKENNSEPGQPGANSQANGGSSGCCMIL